MKDQGGVGRLGSIQGLTATVPHGMVETPCSVDLSFLSCLVLVMKPLVVS